MTKGGGKSQSVQCLSTTMANIVQVVDVSANERHPTACQFRTAKPPMNTKRCSLTRSGLRNSHSIAMAPRLRIAREQHRPTLRLDGRGPSECVRNRAMTDQFSQYLLPTSRRVERLIGVVILVRDDRFGRRRALLAEWLPMRAQFGRLGQPSGDACLSCF